MNPLTPPLAVSAAYVAINNREHGARLMTALRSPGQALAMTRLWNEIRAERKALPQGCPEDLTLAAFAEAVFYLSDNLNAPSRCAQRVVGVTVRTLNPTPALPSGHLWHRVGVGEPWAPRMVEAIPYLEPSETVLHLAAIYHNGDAFAVVGADKTFTTYEEAATVSNLVAMMAPSGLATGLRAARSYVKRDLPGAEQALDLAERLSAAVEGL